MNKAEWIERNKKNTLTCPESGFTINFAGVKFEDSCLNALKPQFDRAIQGFPPPVKGTLYLKLIEYDLVNRGNTNTPTEA